MAHFGELGKHRAQEDVVTNITLNSDRNRDLSSDLIPNIHYASARLLTNAEIPVYL
jgi:hypothetical protein